MTEALIRSRAVLDRATRVLALIGFTGLVAICVMTMYDGLARYGGLPRIPGFRDFGEVIFAVLIASCFPIGLLRNQNITITFLGTALGPRATQAFNLLAAILTLVGMVIIALALIDRTAGLGERMTRTGFFLVSPWAWVATIIMCSAVVIQLWVVLARIGELLGDAVIVEDHAGLTEEGGEAVAAEAPGNGGSPRGGDG